MITAQEIANQFLLFDVRPRRRFYGIMTAKQQRYWLGLPSDVDVDPDLPGDTIVPYQKNNGRFECCAIGVLALGKSSSGKRATAAAEDIAPSLGIENPREFIDGFDGIDVSLETSSYQLGREVADLVFGEWGQKAGILR